jgi:hypothetical protein
VAIGYLHRASPPRQRVFGAWHRSFLLKDRHNERHLEWQLNGLSLTGGEAELHQGLKM